MKAIDMLISTLRKEEKARYNGGIYRKTQVDMAYNSNHIEGSRLSHDHTRELFETRSLLAEKDEVIYADDVVTANNHFRAFRFMLDRYDTPLTEDFIKNIHRLLMEGTAAENAGFPIGDYKNQDNIVGDRKTAPVADVPRAMAAMLTDYHASEHSFAGLVDFHYRFEAIHPFQDGNGRTGRLLLFKECLAAGIIPFIIADDKKQFYYRGLRAYETEPGYLRETCGEAQDNYLLLCCQLIRGFREEAEKENLIRTELLRILDRKK